MYVWALKQCLTHRNIWWMVWKYLLLPFILYFIRHCLTYSDNNDFEITLKNLLDFQSGRWHRRTWLTSLYNHIKITSEISNSHHSELSEIKLNGSLTITELKKPHPSRLVRSMDTWNRLVPHPLVVDKNLGGISWERGVPAPHQVPEPRVPVQ